MCVRSVSCLPRFSYHVFCWGWVQAYFSLPTISAHWIQCYAIMTCFDHCSSRNYSQTKFFWEKQISNIDFQNEPKIALIRFHNKQTKLMRMKQWSLKWTNITPNKFSFAICCIENKIYLKFYFSFRNTKTMVSNPKKAGISFVLYWK